MKISKMFLHKTYTEDELKNIILYLFRNSELSDTTKKQYAVKIPQWITYISTPRNINNLLEHPDESITALESTSKIKHSPSNHHMYISSVVGFGVTFDNASKILNRF